MSGFLLGGVWISAVAIDASNRKLVGVHFLDTCVAARGFAAGALRIRFGLRLTRNVRRNYRLGVCIANRHRMLGQHCSRICGVIGASASEVRQSYSQHSKTQRYESAKPRS